MSKNPTHTPHRRQQMQKKKKTSERKKKGIRIVVRRQHQSSGAARVVGSDGLRRKAPEENIPNPVANGRKKEKKGGEEVSK